MRTITSSSAININNSSSSASAFDPSASRTYSSNSVRTATPSTRSFATSRATTQNIIPLKRLPTAKSPKTPTAQARARFPSAPVPVQVDGASDSRSPPLGYHNRKQQQHVLALTTTTTTRSTSASSAPGSASKMPPDSRPRPPQLSAAAAKTIGRTPLTPKIAVKGPTLSAPLARRSAQNRDDISNTPRSGSRQSTSSTPNGTPNPERGHDGWDPRACPAVEPGRQSLFQSDSTNDADSKFFYASDARPVQQPPSRPSSAAPKPSNFFYANGVTAESKRTLSPSMNPKSTFTPILASPPEPSQSKFFYASGTPEVSSKPNLQSSAPPSTGLSNSRVRPSTSGSANGSAYAMPPRPLSPIKMIQQQNPPPILKNTTAPGLNNRAQISSPPLSSSTVPVSRRRVSIDSTPRSSRGHARTSSIPSIDSGRNSPRVSISSPKHLSESSSPPASPTFTQPVMTMASILQVAEELADNEDGSPELQSPTKSAHSSDPVSELVTNARRERKVQDLEITNASLEAINRTLERQLRKQTAEIRRYRRLSRSGHLSLTSPTSSRVPSQTLADVPMSLTELSDEEEESVMSEEEEPDSFDDSELSSADSASAGDQLGPTGDNDDKDDKNEKDDKVSARRKRDERRLRLDLTKHRELLVDSQKINQSLKRCLNWTEILIKEGQKALEYKVRVSDVQFGGHVLAPPDEDDDAHLDGQLLGGLEADLGSSPSWEKSSQDRDSGIELQPETL